FQHHWPLGGHHEAAIEYALVFRALSFHSCDDGLGDMLYEPVGHLIVHQGRGGVGAHAASVRTSVAVANSLVILGGDQWRYALAIADQEEREFFALQALFENDAGPGVADHLAAQHFRSS